MSRYRLSSIVDITDILDRIASEIQPQNEKLAMAIDMFSDSLEKRRANKEVLDSIATEVQKYSEKLALELDRISDYMDGKVSK